MWGTWVAGGILSWLHGTSKEIARLVTEVKQMLGGHLIVKRSKQEMRIGLGTNSFPSLNSDSMRIQIHENSYYPGVLEVDIFMFIILAIRCPFLISAFSVASLWCEYLEWGSVLCWNRWIILHPSLDFNMENTTRLNMFVFFHSAPSPWNNSDLYCCLGKAFWRQLMRQPSPGGWNSPDGFTGVFETMRCWPYDIRVLGILLSFNQY